MYINSKHNCKISGLFTDQNNIVAQKNSTNKKAQNQKPRRKKDNISKKEIQSCQNTPYFPRHSQTTKTTFLNYLNQLQSNLTTHL